MIKILFLKLRMKYRFRDIYFYSSTISHLKKEINEYRYIEIIKWIKYKYRYIEIIK